MIGDYNVIIVEGEKKCGRFVVSQKVCDFMSFIWRQSYVILDLLESSIHSIMNIKVFRESERG